MRSVFRKDDSVVRWTFGLRGLRLEAETHGGTCKSPDKK